MTHNSPFDNTDDEQNAETNDEQNDQTEMEYLNALITEHSDDLMRHANVVGVGVGLKQVNGEYTDQKAIVVMVTKKMPIAQLGEDDILPTEIKDIPIDVQEMGAFTAGTATY